MSRKLLDFERACQAVYATSGFLLVVTLFAIIVAIIYKAVLQILTSVYAFYILGGSGIFLFLCIGVYLYLTFGPTNHMD